MSKKLISCFIAIFFAFFGVTACGKDDRSDDGDWSDQVVTEFNYVKSLPQNPVPVDRSLYSYDDMSKHLEIEIMGSHYGVVPPLDNPITKYMESQYNISLNFETISTADYNTVLSTRFADQDPPDCIILDSNFIGLAQSLWEMEQLMDGKIALGYMPNTMQYVTEEYIKHATFDGALIGVPRYQISGDYQLMIRRDWLEEYGMAMPKNIEQFKAFAQKCKADGRYLMGDGGYGAKFGMMSGLKSYFGHPAYHTKDGKISHPMLDGTDLEFLKFLNWCERENLLVSREVGWDDFKSYSYNDNVAMVYYPSNSLYHEYWNAKGRADEKYNVWTPMPPFEGKYAPPAAAPSYYFVFPKKMEQYPSYVKRICHMFDQCMYTGDNFFDTVLGGGNNVFGEGVQYTKVLDNGRTEYLTHEEKHPYYSGANSVNGLLPWQNIGLSDRWLDYYYPDKPDYANTRNRVYQEIMEYQRWPNYFEIKLDTVILSNATTFMNTEYEKFVYNNSAGDFSGWNAFVDKYMTTYKGRTLFDAAAEQLGVGKI